MFPRLLIGPQQLLVHHHPTEYNLKINKYHNQDQRWPLLIIDYIRAPFSTGGITNINCLCAAAAVPVSLDPNDILTTTFTDALD
jgi:hypothetical protein